MSDIYLRLQGEDIGAISGRGIGDFVFYKPVNDKVPTSTMPIQELRECIGGERSAYVSVPYGAIRQVEVDDRTVWRNRDCEFSDAMTDPDSQDDYAGRGSVAVEFRNPIGRISAVVDHILAQNVGFERVVK